jgi:hypothetical protein
VARCPKSNQNHALNTCITKFMLHVVKFKLKNGKVFGLLVLVLVLQGGKKYPSLDSGVRFEARICIGEPGSQKPCIDIFIGLHNRSATLK